MKWRGGKRKGRNTGKLKKMGLKTQSTDDRNTKEGEKNRMVKREENKDENKNRKTDAGGPGLAQASSHYYFWGKELSSLPSRGQPLFEVKKEKMERHEKRKSQSNGFKRNNLR